MADQENVSQLNLKIRVSIFLAYGLVAVMPIQAQFTACTTRGNYTDDVYREVPIKNARTSVTIRSPNYPQPYPENIQCTWRILAPVGYKVELSFLEFTLEESYLDSGCHDYVSVRDGESNFNDAKEIRRRCGSSAPPTVRSSGPVLWIRFLTDKKTEEKGFTVKVLPVSGSTSKRYIAIGVLVALLLIIIISIIVCRKRFQRQDNDAPKVRQYQELPVPTDTEPEQTNASNKEPETPEDPWNSDCRTAEQDKVSGAFYLRPLRSFEASGYCSLSEDGSTLDFKNNRKFSKVTPKKPAANEQEELECTELLTVV